MKINAAFVFKPDFACFGNVFMKTSQMQQENIYIFGMDKGIENLAGKIVFFNAEDLSGRHIGFDDFPRFFGGDISHGREIV